MHSAAVTHCYSELERVAVQFNQEVECCENQRPNISNPEVMDRSKQEIVAEVVVAVLGLNSVSRKYHKSKGDGHHIHKQNRKLVTHALGPEHGCEEVEQAIAHEPNE